MVIGLRVVWMLTEAELGAGFPEAPRLAVYAIALFPTAFFLTAVYPESLVLAASAGAFWQARGGRWWAAGLLGGLCSAAHPVGVALLVPLGIMYLRVSHGRLRPDVLWLALVPAGYAIFMAYLGLEGLDPFSPLHAAAVWGRQFEDRSRAPGKRSKRPGPECVSSSPVSRRRSTGRWPSPMGTRR